MKNFDRVRIFKATLIWILLLVKRSLALKKNIGEGKLITNFLSFRVGSVNTNSDPQHLSIIPTLAVLIINN